MSPDFEASINLESPASKSKLSKPSSSAALYDCVQYWLSMWFAWLVQMVRLVPRLPSPSVRELGRPGHRKSLARFASLKLQSDSVLPSLSREENVSFSSLFRSESVYKDDSNNFIYKFLWFTVKEYVGPVPWGERKRNLVVKALSYGSFSQTTFWPGPRKEYTCAGPLAAVLSLKASCLGAPIPDLDGSNNLLNRGPGVFMAHVPSYQQIISNYVLCTVLSCSVSSKGHSFGGHKKMEERK